ncbi:hypothetical protein BGZ54_004629, partial [Gamsiella multidivaricata]
SPSLFLSIYVSATLGASEGDPDLCISRRSPDRSLVEGSSGQGHGTGAGQATGAGVPDQVVEIAPHPNAENTAPRLHHRHEGHVAVGSRGQNQRCPERGVQDDQQGSSDDEAVLILHQQDEHDNRSNIPSTAAFPTSAPVEEQFPDGGQAMDRQSGSHAGGKGGPSLVEDEPPDMEWTMLDPTPDSDGRLHELIGDRMGHCDREPLLVRIVVDASATSSHQCQGAPHGIHGSGSPGMQGQDAEHSMRQYIDYYIHQSLRGHLITRVALLGNEAPVQMPQDGNAPQDHVHPICIQPSRCAILPARGSVGMVDQPRLLLTDGSEVGTTQGGLVCVGTKPPPTTLRVVETMQESSCLGRPATTLETPGMRLLLPSMELRSSSATEGPTGEGLTGEGGCDSHHPFLDVGTLVPDDTGHVDRSTHSDSEGISDTSTEKRTGYSTEKSDVVAYCMEYKRKALMRMGANDSVIAMWNNNKAHKRTLAQRAGSQLQYIRWALTRDIDPLTPNTASLLNFLVSGVALDKWSESTTTTYKSQIIQLYED